MAKRSIIMKLIMIFCIIVLLMGSHTLIGGPSNFYTRVLDVEYLGAQSSNFTNFDIVAQLEIWNNGNTTFAGYYSDVELYIYL